MDLYISYYSVLSLISILFVSFLAGYLLFLTESRSKATKHLGLLFLNLAFFYLSYWVSYAFVEEWGAYHRLGTVLFVLLGLSHIAFFCHHYEGLFFRREYLISRYVLYGIAILNLGSFVWQVLDIPVYFDFSSHQFNLNAGKITSAFILLFFAYAMVTGVRKALRLKGDKRRAMIYITTAIFIIVPLPAVTNVLSLQGIIPRALHMNVFSITTIVGYFILMMVYINHTRDKTTFMVKIVSVSMVVVLLMIQGISMMVMPNREHVYHEVHLERSINAVRYDKVDKSIAYIARLKGTDSGEVEFLRKKDFVDILPATLAEGNLSCHALGKPGSATAPKDRQEYLAINRTKTGADVLQPGSVIWRCGQKKDSLFTGYHVKTSDGGLYEVGFPYVHFRNFEDDISLYISLFAVGLFIFILVIFPLFFKVSLVNPLSQLVNGLDKVNKGDLEAHLEKKVNDEIGFLTDSFNGMVGSIREAQRKLQDHADNLEDKVKERTRELENTLGEVQNLKTQQDGDYFLTSLLNKPLGANHVHSDTIKVDFLVKQKKEFAFRKWKEEIGGDICIAHTVYLKNRKFTVFLNADAMGKSIQGAGGTLVLGAVFQSIIERTKMVRNSQDTFPEQWLKNTFTELQRVFESFDGSMLISVVMGLVDDKTGFLYYMNAEHPWTVLYRDGKASFIENELTFRKLGTSGMSGMLTVKTMQLRPGDVLIAGSDGRDDLLLGKEEDGTRIINEDENLILEKVERAESDLEKIYELLLETGELTDDLSLLRLAWHGKGSDKLPELTEEVVAKLVEGRELIRSGEAEAALPLLNEAEKILGESHPDIHRERIRVYLSKRDYKKMAPELEAYLDWDPSNSEFVYLASFCYKKLKNLDKAVDLGERIRLREPHLIKNLLNLADVYSLQDNFTRAETILKQVFEHDPENEVARRVQKRIQQLKPA